MKNFILSLALIASSLAFSQTTESPRPFTLGVKAGLNLSSLNGNDDSTDLAAGFNGGVFINIPLSSKFSAQPEILYNGLFNSSVRASQINNETRIDNIQQNLHYLSLPIFVQYNITPRFFVEAGPQMSFLLHANYKYTSESIDNSNYYYQSESTNNTKEFRVVDFGIGAGTGYYFIPSLGITARYIAGIGNIKAGGLRNNVIQIGMAYKF